MVDPRVMHETGTVPLVTEHRLRCPQVMRRSPTCGAAVTGRVLLRVLLPSACDGADMPAAAPADLW